MVVPVISNYVCTTNVFTMIELYILKALGHDISKRFVTKFKRIVHGPASVAVIRLRTNERQTRVILQKQLARWASHASLSIPRFNQFGAWSLRLIG